MLDLDRIEALVNAATPGPWRQATHVGEPRAIVAESRPMASLLALDVDGMAIVDSEADAALIVEACNAVHAMAAELRAARAEIERLTTERVYAQAQVLRGIEWDHAVEDAIGVARCDFWYERVLAEIERLRTAAADERADVVAMFRARSKRWRESDTSIGQTVSRLYGESAVEVEQGAHVGAAKGGEK